MKASTRAQNRGGRCFTVLRETAQRKLAILTGRVVTTEGSVGGVIMFHLPARSSIPDASQYNGNMSPFELSTVFVV